MKWFEWFKKYCNEVQDLTQEEPDRVSEITYNFLAVKIDDINKSYISLSHKYDKLKKEFELVKEDLFETNEARKTYKKKWQVCANENKNLLECVEFYADKENWIFSESLPSPHIGIKRTRIIERDKEIGLLCEGEHDDVGGSMARQCLKELKEGE